MKPANSRSDWVLTPDALKLSLILGVFIWLTLCIAMKRGVRDFSVLYTSGGIILEGHRAQLFDVQTQTEFQHRVLGMLGLLPFNHLSYESLLFVPLALLPFTLALWIWRIVSVWTLLLSSRILAQTFHAVRTQVFLLALALFPVAVAIIQGQDSILILLLFSSSLAALTQGKDRRAGVLLALALFKPHLVLPIAAVLIWKMGYRFLQGFLGGSAAVFLISVGVTGTRGWRQMTELMHYAAYGTDSSIGGVANLRPNIRGILGLLGVDGHHALIFAILISALLFLLVAWYLRNEQSPEILFPPLVALALLTSIHVNVHDLSILFIPVLAMLVQENKSTSICAAACFCMPLFWISGYNALYFFVIGTTLFLTLQQGEVTGKNANSEITPV